MTQTKVELIDAKNSVTISGSTPSLTIGDAGAEDTKIVFDGNAQDFYIGLDDSADDLVIGVGSTVGTTPAIHVDENKKVTVGESGVASTISGITFFQGDTGSIYTHDVSGTDSTAQYNTAYGLTALDAITTGDDNTVVGYAAAGALTTGANNVIIGKNTAAANAMVGDHNTFVGGGAAYNATDCDRNTIIGRDAGYALTDGDDNVIVGEEAGKAITTGYNNVLIGKDAGESITTAARNVFIGYQAGDGHDAETYNVGIGEASLGGSIAGGEYNTAVGSHSLDALTSGDNNTAVGMHAGTSITTGPSNTAVGYYCLQQVTEGQSNTGIGKNVYEDLTTGDYNTGLGGECEVSSSDAQHQITIGYGLGSNGDNNFTFGKAGNRVYNDFSSNASWTRSSDERKKQNIKDDYLGLDFINELRPVTFQWKPSNEFPKEWKEYSEENHMDTEVVMHGLIAQEVKSALDNAGVDTFGGWTENTDGMQNISREMFVFPLIKAVQELSAKVKELESK